LGAPHFKGTTLSRISLFVYPLAMPIFASNWFLIFHMVVPFGGRPRWPRLGASLGLPGRPLCHDGFWLRTIQDMCKIIYIYIGRRLGVPRKPIAFYLYGYGTCWFTLCFTVFYAFPWKCSISQSFNVGADKLDVCPRRKMINLHLPWMAKNMCNILTIGIAVPCIFGRFVDN